MHFSIWKKCMSTYYTPGIVLGTDYTKVDKNGSIVLSCSLSFNLVKKETSLASHL